MRPTMDEIDHMQALSEMIYEHAERRTSYSDEIVSQLLPVLVLLSANLPPCARCRSAAQSGAGESHSAVHRHAFYRAADA